MASRHARLRPDAATALLRALGERLARAGAVYRVEELRCRSWASVTFTGARHRLVLLVEGEESAERFLAGIEEAEFALPLHILADIAVESRERSEEGVRIALEALTVEDD
jgi:hypothetical protein